ncbi:MAG TPA: Rieske (2Fe-2S) protein [Thermoanaerobaculia bacterium]|nr:Rieske (2Fe-2S) protein [Thermoanaerobaculia bacterium]
MSERTRVDTPDQLPPESQPRWRRDFPIDRPEDDLVARRDFGAFLVLTSLAFVVGQAWIGVKSLLRRRLPAPGSERVARADELAAGDALAFSYQGEDALLLRLGDGELVAYSSKCTHLACAVVPELDQGRLLCPCHHGYFDAASGRPIAGPPNRPLPRILLEERDGWVWAVGRRVST